MSAECAHKARKSKETLTKRFFLLALIGGGYCLLLFAALHPKLPSKTHPLIFYSNHLRHDLKWTVLKVIQNAKKSIIIQIYGLTDPEILNLLLQKQAQGLDVLLFYDEKASKHLPSSLIAYPVKSSGLMHRKILILDDTLVFLGTANFTTHSLKMHDNLILGIYDPSFALFLKESVREKESFEIDSVRMNTFLLPDAKKDAQQALFDQIAKAQHSIEIAMFTFTHPKLISLLGNAVKRGVSVTLAIDHYTAAGASKKAMTLLREAGVKILESQGSQLLHHKWALIDSKTLILGSANWTRSAFSKNQDLLLILENLQIPHQKIINTIWKKVIANSN